MLWHWDRFFWQNFGFSPVSIMPPVLHTHHLCAALTRRTSGKSLGIFKQSTVFFFFFLLLHRAFWYSHSSFTNRCTFIKTLIEIYIKIRWLLHVSVYNHHQGACNWTLRHAAAPPHNKSRRNLTECFNINMILARLNCKLPDDGRRPKHVGAN